MRTKRSMNGCFSIEEKGIVTKVVTMGGVSSGLTAQILDVATMQWQNLPDLPFKVRESKCVESVIGPYLGFCLGGCRKSSGCEGWWSSDAGEQKIIGLRKNQTGYYWEIVNSQLTTGRAGLSLVNAPLSMVEWQPSC